MAIINKVQHKSWNKFQARYLDWDLDYSFYQVLSSTATNRTQYICPLINDRIIVLHIAVNLPISTCVEAKQLHMTKHQKRAEP